MPEDLPTDAAFSADRGEPPPDHERPASGLVRRIVRAGTEELLRPRARLRRTLRRARGNVRSASLVSAVGCAVLAGAVFPLYATGVGAARGAAASGVFLGAFVGFLVGGPLLLVYAWPAVVLGAAVLLLWGSLVLGPGAMWLGAATTGTFLIVYLASAEMAPLVGAGVLGTLALEIGRAAGIAVFCLTLGLFYWARGRLTAPILAAAWTGLAGSAAARAAWIALGERGPDEWRGGGGLPGPGGLALWTAVAALLVAALVWSRRRGREAAPS